MLYNVSDHRRCFEEVGSQAVSYTTGVPAMIGAKMMLTGAWKRADVFNMEQFDPDPCHGRSQSIWPAMAAAGAVKPRRTGPAISALIPI